MANIKKSIITFKKGSSRFISEELDLRDQICPDHNFIYC